MMLDSSLEDRTDGESRVQSHPYAEGFLQLHINCYGSFHTHVNPSVLEREYPLMQSIMSITISSMSS